MDTALIAEPMLAIPRPICPCGHQCPPVLVPKLTREPGEPWLTFLARQVRVAAEGRLVKKSAKTGGLDTSWDAAFHLQVSEVVERAVWVMHALHVLETDGVWGASAGDLFSLSRIEVPTFKKPVKATKTITLDNGKKKKVSMVVEKIVSLGAKSPAPFNSALLLLREVGFVRDMGRRRTWATNRRCIVWQPIPEEQWTGLIWPKHEGPVEVVPPLYGANMETWATLDNKTVEAHMADFDPGEFIPEEEAA